jgi:FMN phosphatase YigB (HAD superfamily)
VAEGIRAVLFDFAGTLCAPRETTDCVRRAAEGAGVSLTHHEIAELASEYLAAGFPGGPYPDAVPSSLLHSYEQRDLGARQHREAYVGLLSTVAGPVPGFATALYEQVLSPDGWVPYPDAQPLVAEIAGRGLTQGVISNVGFDLRPVLSHHGLGVLGDRCTLSFEHGIAKPDPRLFQIALGTLGTKPAETLMVGDHPEVDEAASALGMKTYITPMAPAGAIRGLRRVLEHV